MKNYYKILKIDPKTEHDKIRKAYIALAKKYHPDINKNADAPEKFKEILEAYQVLSDKELRKEYDFKLKYGKLSGNLADFEERVATLSDLALIITLMRFYKTLKINLAGTGIGAGASIGGYLGGRFGGLPGIVIGGLIGGIAGGIGGFSFGKFVENQELQEKKYILNEAIINFIGEQSPEFRIGINEIILMNWEHPDIPVEPNIIKNILSSSKPIGTYRFNSDISMIKSYNHVEKLIKNNPTFDIIAQYIHYIKTLGSRNDKEQFEKICEFDEEILKNNKVKEQRQLMTEIQQTESELNEIKKETDNNETRNTVLGCLTPVIIIISIIISCIVPISIPIIILAVVFLYRYIYAHYRKKNAELEKQIPEKEVHLKNLKQKLNNLFTKLKN